MSRPVLTRLPARTFLALAGAVALAGAGCQQNGMEESSAMSTTPLSSVSSEQMPKMSDMTHKTMMEAKAYAAMPGPDDKPSMMMPAGSMVLVMQPGATYSKVVTENGKIAWLPTRALDPIGKK